MSAAISNQRWATEGLSTEQAKDVRKKLEHEHMDTQTLSNIQEEVEWSWATGGGYEAVE